MGRRIFHPSKIMKYFSKDEASWGRWPSLHILWRNPLCYPDSRNTEKKTEPLRNKVFSLVVLEKVRCQSYPDRRYIPGWLLSTAKPGKTRTLAPCVSARMVSLFYPSHAGCLATLLALSPVSLPTKYWCPSFIKTVPLPPGTPFPLMDPPYLPTSHSIPPNLLSLL